MEELAYRRYMSKEELHKSLNTLVGILKGIVIDGAVNDKESEEVKFWYDLHKPLIAIHPFKEILPALDLVFEDGRIDLEEAKGILWLCDKFLDKKQSTLYFNMVTSSIQQLEGILHGIISDNVITDSELQKLWDWLNDNEQIQGLYPYDEVYSLLLAAREDGIISADEKNMLRAFFSTFVDTTTSANIHAVDVSKLQQQFSINGICAVDPEIIVPDRLFCFTGVSNQATRDEICNIIVEKGGKCCSTPTNKTDYLVVGGGGNPCWAYTCYGRKVEKAMDIRKKGHKILIVHENDFWDAVR